MNKELQSKIFQWINLELKTSELIGKYEDDECDYSVYCNLEELYPDDLTFCLSFKGKRNLGCSLHCSITNIKKAMENNDVKEIERQKTILHDNLVDRGFLKDKFIKSKQRIPEGYFECWECGCVEPISKMKSDGTCGC